jgi:hypothetical protein
MVSLVTSSFRVGGGFGRHRVLGGAGGNAVLVTPPSISGTRGGTLTATPGTWTGATSVTAQWYVNGTATGNTTTSYNDASTSTSAIEYRETAMPGSVTASAFLSGSGGALLREDGSFLLREDGSRILLEA